MILLFFQVLLDTFSRHVYQLSGSADLVKTYLVELPASWRNTECTAHLAATAEGRLDAADLHVSGNDPLWEEAPHARQYGGCGVRGSGVDLPFAVLTDGVDMEAARLNASLLELVRWRYGVFAEVGFAGDLMYPAVSTLGERMLENAGCDDMSEGGLCPLTAAYRGDAATKQNLLCRERSARRTILDQFAGGQLAAAPQHFSKPNLTYLLPADTERLVLLLEQSERMEAHWRAVLASTFHFINSLEEGTELAVVVFSQAATVQLEPTRVVGGNREGLHYRIPRRLSPGHSGDSSCLECGLAAAVQLATNTTTLVLLTSAGGASANLSNYLASGGPTLRHIVLGHTSAPVSSAGSSYLVESSGDSFPDTASRVSSALASSVHIHPGRKFHQER